MNIGVELLNLVTEYQESVQSRSTTYSTVPGTPTGREPSEIAADFEAQLRNLVNKA